MGALGYTYGFVFVFVVHLWYLLIMVSDTSKSQNMIVSVKCLCRAHFVTEMYKPSGTKIILTLLHYVTGQKLIVDFFKYCLSVVCLLNRQHRRVDSF